MEGQALGSVKTTISSLKNGSKFHPTVSENDVYYRSEITLPKSGQTLVVAMAI
jgi:hypothetical protein